MKMINYVSSWRDLSVIAFIRLQSDVLCQYADFVCEGSTYIYTTLIENFKHRADGR